MLENNLLTLKKILTSFDCLLCMNITQPQFNQGILTPIYLLYQHSGDAKTPYLAQYSAVVSEDAPVNASNTTMKNNIRIKNK